MASHPHALAQTAGRLADLFPDIVPLPTSSTAGAAEAVAAGKYDAAVCAPIAAERYGLVPLVDDLADRPGAVTRFVLVTPARGARPRRRATTRRRWWPWSVTAPARCSNCSASSPSAASR